MISSLLRYEGVLTSSKSSRRSLKSSVANDLSLEYEGVLTSSGAEDLKVFGSLCLRISFKHIVLSDKVYCQHFKTKSLQDKSGGSVYTTKEDETGSSLKP
ncbi:hypothetical protein L6452_09465 [Arctium lappa]|uniref:Uncharacterized protein n=1 Tax=Arctium lappa TaxID=4217 RepID=A0ACB9DK39_ARCLA|nr:hypothetical protein L6452_09465 [Arctium lappa]